PSQAQPPERADPTRQMAPSAEATQPEQAVQPPEPQPQEQHEQVPEDPTMIIIASTLKFVDLTLRDYFLNEMSGTDFAAWFCDAAIPLPPPFNMMQESITGAEALVRQFTAKDPKGTSCLLRKRESRSSWPRTSKPRKSGNG